MSSNVLPGTDAIVDRVAYREGFNDGFGRAAEIEGKKGNGKGREDGGQKDGSPETDHHDAKGPDQKKDDASEQSQNKAFPPFYKRPFVVALAIVVLLALIIGTTLALSSPAILSAE